MLTNMSEITDKVQKVLGREFLKASRVINVPGKSLACKVDPFYYLVPIDVFLRSLAVLTGTPPARLETALVKTGNLVSGEQGATGLELDLLWQSAMSGRARFRAGFLLSDFIDRALILYGGRSEPMPISHLRIDKSCRERVRRFFVGKTMPNSIAFDEPVKAQPPSQVQRQPARPLSGSPVIRPAFGQTSKTSSPTIRKFEFNRE